MTTTVQHCSSTCDPLQSSTDVQQQSSLLMTNQRWKLGSLGWPYHLGLKGAEPVVPVSALIGALDHDQQQTLDALCVSQRWDSRNSQRCFLQRTGLYVPKKLSAKLCVSACSWNGAFLEMRMCRHLSWSYTLTENLITGSHMKVWNWTLIAGCTDPGHSWANPAKRGMSMPKLAFQNTALPTEDSEKQWWDAGHLRQSREWRSTQMSGAHLFHLYRLYWRAASPVSS